MEGVRRSSTRRRNHVEIDLAPWFRNAILALGVAEIEGAEHNPEILRWLETCDNVGAWGKSRDETANCAAFVNCMLEDAGYPSTRHCLARKYMDYGEPCDPFPGAIIVIRRKIPGYDALTGSRRGFHTGFWANESARRWKVLGANQNNRVSFKWFPKWRYDLMAIVRPVDV